MRCIVCFLPLVIACSEAVSPKPSITLARAVGGQTGAARGSAGSTAWLSAQDQKRADSIIAFASVVAERTRDVAIATEIWESIPSIGLFHDSVRYNRAIDRVAVTLEVARGGVQRDVLGRYFPRYTPHLAWARIPGKGLHFQPVNTVQVAIYPIPKPWHGPTRRLASVATALWHYAIPGPLGPRWEYDFVHSSGGVERPANWHSALAQSYAIMLFAECYRRTGAPVWRERALAVLPTLTAEWSAGGVRLADTTHGYWMEEFHPDVRVFNGAAQAAMHLWTAANALPHDGHLRHAARRASEAVLFYAPLYEDGRWTRYSLTQGWNSVDYHWAHVEYMNELAVLTGDTRFRVIAARWEAFVRPF